MTDIPGTGVRPADRYGDDLRTRRRRPLVLAVAAAAAALVALLCWIAYEHATPDVSGGVLGYRVLDDRHVTVSVRVSKDPDRSAVCRVRALDRDWVTVGTAQQVVGPAPGRHVQVSIEIPTRSRAVNGELVSCRALDGD